MRRRWRRSASVQAAAALLPDFPGRLRQAALGRRSARSDPLHTQPDSHQSQQDPPLRPRRGGDELTARARSPWTPSRAGEASGVPQPSYLHPRGSAQVRKDDRARFLAEESWSADHLPQDLSMSFSFNASELEESQISCKPKLQPHFPNPSSSAATGLSRRHLKRPLCNADISPPPAFPSVGGGSDINAAICFSLKQPQSYGAVS